MQSAKISFDFVFYWTRFSYLINFNLNRDTIIANHYHRRDVRSKSIKLGFVIRIRVEKLHGFTAKLDLTRNGHFKIYTNLSTFIQNIFDVIIL